ncbi:MAG: phosphate signaling complex protein PhoU [Alphaproteobacteria bacterium]
MPSVGTPHTVRAYDQELKRLHATIVGMGRLAENQVAASIQALSLHDTTLAADIIANDAQIDEGEHTVNELTVRLLALRSPVADDLRLVVSTLKVAGELERVADLAVNIAKRVLSVSEAHMALPVSGITRMGGVVVELLRDVVDAYDQRDVGRAVTVWQADQDVDDQCSALFRELLTYMMEDPRNITSCSHLMFIAKNVERIGDHATNIAEAAHYMITGQTLTGDRPKKDVSSLRME